MSDNDVELIYARAQAKLAGGCPGNENHFLRCELAMDNSHAKVWCSDCGWGVMVYPQGIGPLGGECPAAPIEPQDFVKVWIESRGGSVSESWEISKMVEALKPLICKAAE